MIELVLASDDFGAIFKELLDGQTESCAVLFARQVVRKDGTGRLLVKVIDFPTNDDYSRRGAIEAELRPEYVARVTKRARREGYSLIFAHSHPGKHPPLFSTMDDAGEEHLAKFLERRHPGLHGALVISEGGVRARVLGSGVEAQVIALGEAREVRFNPQQSRGDCSELFDRQVRAFGSEGQQNLQRLCVAIVGLGGTGSIIAQKLAHLGVRNFLLIDPDVIELTNLNRVVGAKQSDVTISKVDVASRNIKEIVSDANVHAIQGDVIRARVAMELANADVIFGCTDSHGSRAVIQQVCYQYLIPGIDMGTVITAENGKIEHILGRVQLLSPGLACLTCGGLLNPDEVRRDMMTAFERQADPYIMGAREPAPAVISINGTVASLAVTMLLSVVVGTPMKGRHILYNAVTSTLRTVRANPNPSCYICSRSGAVAEGDAWPLLTRQD